MSSMWWFGHKKDLKAREAAGKAGNGSDEGKEDINRINREKKKEGIMALERDIIMALRQVYDPEIPVNIYDLGLVYELKVDDGHNVYIQMTLTAPNCPMADYVVDAVKAAVEDVPGVVSAKIELVFEPVWDKSRMSEEALVELGLDTDD